MRKTFGRVVALEGLDLAVPRGRITGLLGPNGSGKTTTMRLVLQILLPDQGQVQVLGTDQLDAVKRRIGYLPEDRGLYKNMRVRGFLTYMARLRGVPSKGLDATIRQWLDRVDLGDKLKERCGVLSRGQQQRVQTIGALIHSPDLLILDEPFSGLDPVNRRVLSEIFAEQHARGCTLILSTHMMEHAEEVCEHVVMMDRGHKVLDVSLADARKSAAAALICEPLDPTADLAPLATLPGVERLHSDKSVHRLVLADGVEPSRVLASAAAAVPLARVEIERLSLEEIFVRTVQNREVS